MIHNDQSLQLKPAPQSHTQWRARARGAAILGALLVPLALSGCGSNSSTTPTTNPGDTNNIAARDKALEANPNVPPQAKQQMLGNQGQSAGSASKP